MTAQFDKQLEKEADPLASPRLRVMEAHLEDVEQGIARVQEELLMQMGLYPGDTVLIKGERQTLVRVYPRPPDEAGRRQIRLDGLTRENAGISLDDRIRITPHPVAPAATLLLAPTEKVTLGPDEVRRVREWLTARAVMKEDKISVPLFSRRGTQFVVSGFEPDAPAALATEHTDVRIQEYPRGTHATQYTVKYEDIGGLDGELRRIREMIELPMKYPELFAHLRIEPPKGVLLYGPPGTGKTTIARAVASEVKAHFLRINGPEVIHKFYGESEAKLRELFDEAQRKAPSIIFIDEIDAIAPKRADVAGEVEKRVVAQLLALMDGMVSRGEVVVIGATNLPELLDSALRRPGRFDREVVVRVPNRPGRLQILKIHSRGMPLADDVDMEKLAEITHGFVGADLEALCKEAGMASLQDVLEREDFAEKEIGELASETAMHMRHFLVALKGIEPTATREFFAERPNVRWDSVGGLHQAKALLRSTVDMPHRYPALYQKAGASQTRGVLLSGKPGTGKTLLVRALATETGFSFISVDAAALFSKWVGESEKALRQVFTRAKQAAPCILFFDELDSLFPRREQSLDLGGRERLTGQFIAELDGMDATTDVVVIGATNRLDMVEPALLNPGRFGLVIDLKSLNKQERGEVLEIHLADLPLAAEVDANTLAEKTAGLAGAELATLCQRASLERLQQFIEEYGELADHKSEEFRIRGEDFDKALEALLQSLRERNPNSDTQQTP